MEFVRRDTDEVFDTYWPGQPDDLTSVQRREELLMIREEECARLAKERHSLRVILTRWYRRLGRFTVRAVDLCRRMPIIGAYPFTNAGRVLIEATTRFRRECEPEFARTRLQTVDNAIASWSNWEPSSDALPVFLS